jgi:hypothetical protein
MRFLVLAMGLAACARGGMGLPDGNETPRADARSKDGPGQTIDAPASTSDAPAAATAPLLLSEVELVTAGHEFIEIVNPTTSPVDLTTYYLADIGDYFKLPAAIPTVSSGDFIVKFPNNSSIAAHGVVTVALGTAAAFTSAYGVAPTYSISDDTMVRVTAPSVPTLTDTGEIVVLFMWNGATPLVKDVDLVLAGVPSSTNTIVPKGGYAQNGGTYAADSNTLPAQASAPAANKSTKRLILETGHETQAGSGNGIDGDDETSEQTGTTWDTTATFGAPTPGMVPTALLQ